MSLLNAMVARVRQAETLFEDRVKGVLTLNMGEDQLRMNKPFLLIAPASETSIQKPSESGEAGSSYSELTRVRQYVFGAVFDATDSIDGSGAVLPAEVGIEQLIELFVNWTPDQKCYGPMLYESMKIGDASAVDALFVLFFTVTQHYDVSELNQGVIDETPFKTTIRATPVVYPNPLNEDSCDEP